MLNQLWCFDRRCIVRWGPVHIGRSALPPSEEKEYESCNRERSDCRTYADTGFRTSTQIGRWRGRRRRSRKANSWAWRRTRARRGGCGCGEADAESRSKCGSVARLEDGQIGGLPHYLNGIHKKGWIGYSGGIECGVEVPTGLYDCTAGYGCGIR